MLYYLRRLLSNSAEAEDTLQEVWLTVVRKLPTLEKPEAFKGWIYRIAHNRAISRLRRRRPELPIDDLADEVDRCQTTDASDEAELFGSFEAAAVHRGLDRLSSAHREVLALRFVDELAYDEIAQIVGRSIGTVRSRLHYAKRTLSQYLSKEIQQ